MSQTLLAEIESRVVEVLTEAGVYDIASVGWLNADDPDPEALGHAMWQVNQPPIDYNAASGISPVLHRPGDVEREILTTGEDFCALMKFSRLSIGLTLLWKPGAMKTVLNDSDSFRLHQLNAYLKLSIASDRLRDLLAMACSGQLQDQYKKSKKSRRLYATPFIEACELLATRGVDIAPLAEPLAELPGQGAEIFHFIDQRNTIVHEVATDMAKGVQNLVKDLQGKFDDQQKNGYRHVPLDSTNWLQQIEVIEEGHRSRLDSSVQDLITWYGLLLSTSNNVFQIEYQSRMSNVGYVGT